jgi:hypothetical protein
MGYFHTAFHAQHIPKGIMAMKLEQFLKLQQENLSVREYLAQYNHLCQYAHDNVNTDEKRKEWFMRGLDPEIQKQLASNDNATYHEAVNIALTIEDKDHLY